MASKLADLLKQNNVETIYFGLGSRNQSLISKLNEFKQVFHYDERSLSFAALGEAKQTQRPVAICVTSGTAVSECLSAMIEAYYAKVPLIMISTDRPERLRGTDAPQAIEQRNIFNDYTVEKQSCSEDDLELKTLVFPAHLNIEIETTNNPIVEMANELDTKIFKEQLTNATKTLSIVTADLGESDLKRIEGFSDYLLIESSSQLCGYESRKRSYNEFALIEKIKREEINLLLLFGEIPVSKIWRLLDQYSHLRVIRVGGKKLGTSRGDYYLGEIPVVEKTSGTIEILEKNIHTLIEKFPESELAFIAKIKNQMQRDDIVYIGNSMPIRYWQLIDDGAQFFHASRGANGIDGQIATAIGIAVNTEKQVHCLIGDLTFLYDFSSLLWSFPKNLSIHVIDNDGGRIFERVPTDKKMIFTGERDLAGLISFLQAYGSITRYLPNISQTREFWEEWSLEN